jgi:fluoride exporter
VSAWVWVAVALLGGGAAIGRSLLDVAISSHTPDRLPLGTFVVNTSGALLLGVLSGLAVQGYALVLIGGATLGSFTTFSTWMLQTRRLSLDGEAPTAVVNVLLSLAVGVGGVAFGRLLGTYL